MSNANESRWWEFYGVRYAMGTVIGALLVHYIFSTNTYLKPLLFLPDNANNFGMAHLTLLAAYGLAYCYIASAPILVFHAARSFFFHAKNNWTLTLAFTAAALVVGLLLFCLSESLFQSIALTVLILLFFLQAVYVWLVFSQFDTPQKYYQTLVKQRESSDHVEFVESYKHLREHGNSFLIVFFEFLLAFILVSFTSEKMAGYYIFSADAVRNLFLILFFWVIPPACIWGFGNKLEQSLVDQKET